MYGALNDSSAVPSAGSMSSQAGALLARARRWDASMPIAASMLGTVLFLRLGEAVGALGLGYTALALVLCFIITLLTVGSMSAIASNSTCYSCWLNVARRCTNGAMRFVLCRSHRRRGSNRRPVRSDSSFPRRTTGPTDRNDAVRILRVWCCILAARVRGVGAALC